MEETPRLYDALRQLLGRDSSCRGEVGCGLVEGIEEIPSADQFPGEGHLDPAIRSPKVTLNPKLVEIGCRSWEIQQTSLAPTNTQTNLCP